MRIHVQLAVDGQAVKQDVITIEEQRLGELSEEEMERAIEVRIRSWVDAAIQVEWETEE